LEINAPGLLHRIIYAGVHDGISALRRGSESAQAGKIADGIIVSLT
jgi:hypothetical protein